MNKRGISLYLTFLVCTLIFILVLASYAISRTALDLGRSEALETQVFHAADGGIERGLARLRQEYSPFSMSYTSRINSYRHLIVKVEAKMVDNLIEIQASAGLLEGNRVVAKRQLKRCGVENLPGRAGIGKLVEAS